MVQAAAGASIDGPIRLTLGEALARAIEVHTSVVEARERVVSADLQYESAVDRFRVRVIPRGRVGLSAGTDLTTDEQASVGLTFEQRTPIGGVVRVGPRSDFGQGFFRSGFDASLSQPLLRGASPSVVRGGIASAEYGQRSAARAMRLSQVRAVLAAVSAIYGLIDARQQLDLSQSSLERLDELVRVTELRDELGLIEGADVFRARNARAEALEQVRRAEEALRSAREELLVQLEYPLGADVWVEAPLEFSLYEVDENSAVQTAVTRRVELAQAKDALAESYRQQRIARDGLLPDVNLGLNYFLFGQDASLDESWNLDRDTVSVNISTSFDLSPVDRRNAVTQSGLVIDQAMRSVAMLRRDIELQARRQVRSLASAEDRMVRAHESRRRAADALEVAILRFRHGLASNLDVVAAESAVEQAERAILSVVIEYITGQFRLRAVLGTLIEYADTRNEG